MVYDQNLLKGSKNSFKVYRMVKHHQIQVKFDFRGHSQILSESWPFFDLGLG